MRDRWRAALAGVYRGEVGEYDEQVALALRFNWTPEQVARMPRAFVDELLERLTAEATAPHG